MKISFFSNFLNHHQLPFCQEMIKILGEDFKFIATEKIPKDRIELGYEDMNEKYNFVIRSYENEEEAFKLGIESDVVIIGSAPSKYIKERLKQKKLTFRYSERVFKNGFRIKTFLSILYKRTIRERDNSYLLCASAYSANDYNLAGAYKNKCYKWGYFPEVIKYKDIYELVSNKKKNTILWVGRFIDWKHPEVMIDLANKLKRDGYNFKITMIGIGELKEEIKHLVNDNDLNNYIELLEAMSPKEVRKYMEKSQLFLFTSDKAEGWGAVLNESMNSGCAVVASHAIGSVPFLIKDKKNGLIYKDGNINDLYNKVRLLLENSNNCKELGIEAYKTMINLWSPSIASKRIIELANSLLKNIAFDNYNDGPCSKAERLKDK